MKINRLLSGAINYALALAVTVGCMAAVNAVGKSWLENNCTKTAERPAYRDASFSKSDDGNMATVHLSWLLEKTSFQCANGKTYWVYGSSK